MSDKSLFYTDNLDLGAFLMLSGLEYLDCELVIGSSPKKKPKVIMCFADTKQNARDLERVFLSSQEKRYRDLTKYLLREVHKKINDFKNNLLDEESR